MQVPWSRMIRLGILSGLALATLAAPPSDARAAGKRAAGKRAPAPAPTPAPAPPPNLKEVIVVFKTHFDIGFTEMPSTVVNNYRTKVIDKAMDTCDQALTLPPDQRFAWTVPGWPLAQMLWTGQTPERRARLTQALRDGRIIFHAWPVTMHTESADLEDVVRGMSFSSGLARQLGQPLPRDAKMTDVPEHTWILPTIMKHAGIDFFHIGCNGGSSCPDVPTLFWWEGPDGSRLLTMYSKNYGTELMPPADWPFKTWLCMKMTGDNHGPPTAKEVKAMFAEAERTLPGIKVRVGRLSDFYDAIVKENPPNIPVVRKDMPDTWIHGLESMPVETRALRNARVRLGALQVLDTEMNAWELPGEPLAAKLASAYENSVMYSEHTWGMDVKKFGHRFGEDWKQALAAGKYDKMLKAFDEHRTYAHKTEATAFSELTSRLTRLAGAVGAAGPRIVVFNPLPWSRTTLASGGWAGAAEVNALKDAASGELILVNHEGNKISFLARDVPPFGYRTYQVVNDAPQDSTKAIEAGNSVLAADAKAGTLENKFLKVKLDPARGGIVSMIDKRSGRELVDAAAPQALGQYFYERFDASNVATFNNAYNRWDRTKKKPAWIDGDFGKQGLPPAATNPYAAAGATAPKLEMIQGVNSVSATLECPAKGILADVTQLRVTLGQDQPYVEIQWSVMRKKQGDPWPEAGWLALPFKVKDPVFKLGRLGSIVDPAKDLVPGSNHHLYAITTGLTVTGADGAGVGICPIDSPLVSLDTPGIWKFDREWTPKKAQVFVNLYNNMWSTNFPQWIDGTWSSRVRVWAVEPGTPDEAALITPGLEARSPLLVAHADQGSGKLPPMQAGLELSRKGVQVTAFGPNPDGQGTILRLWEQAGQGGECKVKLPKGFKAASAQPVDLRGRTDGAKIPVKDGELEVDVKAFAPMSLLFE